MADTATLGVDQMEFHPVTLEFNASDSILAEGSPDASGVMRVKVPFYVSNSTARVGGFDRPMFFPAETLPGILQEARRQIDEGNLPLTVYARHAHATSAEYLPIGRVAEVMAEGNTGYAILEIAPVGMGLEVQGLIKAGMLNSVSLRSRRDYELEPIKLGGEPHLAARKLPLAGIDFAPDGPAQPTYGVQVLNEVPRVEPDPAVPAVADGDPIEQEEPVSEQITLDAVRARADIVAAIEQPHRDRVAELEGQVATLTAERDAARGRVVTLEAEVARAEVENAIGELAARFPDPARARTILAEACKEATSKDAVYAKATPILLDVMAARGAQDETEQAAETTPAPAAVLAEMFGGSGRVVRSEGEQSPATPAAPKRGTVLGLAIPE